MHALIDSGSLALPPAPFNLARHVLEARDRTPDKIALQILTLSGAERWSYAALGAAVRGIGTGLIALGLGPGDRVLFYHDFEGTRTGNFPSRLDYLAGRQDQRHYL